MNGTKVKNYKDMLVLKAEDLEQVAMQSPNDQMMLQELYCHNYENYVQFKIDTTLNGRHVLNCPKCGHEHCRYVLNGVISEQRWDSRNQGLWGASYTVTYTSWSQQSYYSQATGGGTGSMFLADAWANTTGTSTAASSSTDTATTAFMKSTGLIFNPGS